MSSIEVIENKISSIRKYLDILDRYKKYSVKEIKENVDVRGALERYLYLAVQATIDLAETVIAYKNLRKPTTLAESFDILYEEKIVKSRSSIDQLISMVGFRNIIAHDYGEINYDIVHDILQVRLQDIQEFVEIIRQIK